jgi:hypothetical protein
MASDSSAPSSPATADYGNVPLLPSESWAPSTLTEEDLQDIKVLLGRKVPLRAPDETVVFWSFYEKGFGLPAGAFFRGLLHCYELEATDLKPNLICKLQNTIETS